MSPATAVHLILLILRPIVDATISGYYVDNGRGQTVVHRGLTVTETHQIQQHLLSVLGLPERPADLWPTTMRHSEPASSMRRKSAAVFLLDLYHRQQEREQLELQEEGGDFDYYDVQPEQYRMMDGPLQDLSDTADTIMTFMGHRHRHRPYRRVATAAVAFHQRLWFDVTATSTLSNNAQLLSGELHLYKEIPADRENDVSARPDDTYLLQVHDTLDGCRLIDPDPRMEHPRPQARRRHRLVASARIAWHRSGWMRLNVTGVFERWQRQYRHPVGGQHRGPIRPLHCPLYVSAQLMRPRQQAGHVTGDGDGLEMRHLHNVGVLMGTGAFQPFVVGYLMDDNRYYRRQRRRHHRQKRNRVSSYDEEYDVEYEDVDRHDEEDVDDDRIDGRRRRHRRHRRYNKRNSERHRQRHQRRRLRPLSRRHNPLLEPRVVDTVRSCQRQALYVSFKDLTWQDWVISPRGYEAFYCSGDCVFPLTGRLNATHQAIVQTLMHLLHPTIVPRPSCAPALLGSFRVLYYLDDWNVNLKTFRDTVVQSCGCQ